MKKLVFSAIVLLLASAGFFVLNGLTENEDLGQITIIVIDENNNERINEKFDFIQEDTLFDLLQENYQVGCADSSYKISYACESTPFGARVILSINEVETNWTDSFIAIYVNGEYSIYGIDDIALKEGSIYRFEYATYGGE